MLPFEVTILGSSSALPAYGRHPSAQVMNVHDQLYLIDCGEGVQMQFERFDIKRSKFDQIFISHLHGDHIFGLMPLLTTYSLLRRERPLHIFGPHPLSRFIHAQLDILEAKLSFDLQIHEMNTDASKWIYQDPYVQVKSFPLRHRVPTVGYLFQEQQKPPSILSDQMEAYGVHYRQVPKIRKGEAVKNEEGKLIPAHLLSAAAPPARSFAYCSDTRYMPELADELKGVNLLYHEATFAEALSARAEKTMHSTAQQAAMIAKKAGAQQLLIGHFSTRYPDLSGLLNEARSLFPNTELALEGKIFEVSQVSEDQ